MAAYTEDDGFHEIQLNGKQLVFLFMAATVVSVVIFLCGVLVGRGVRAERGDIAQAATEEVAPVPAAEAARAADPPAADPARTPPPAVDELSYFDRLEKPTRSTETLNKPPVRAEPPARVQAVEVPPVVPRAAAKTSAPPTDATPSSSFAVQVAALNVRSEADAMARRLSSKGYAAYVLASASGAPVVFRVRIGSFKSRREADAMAARLQKEEQFKPWVTR